MTEAKHHLRDTWPLEDIRPMDAAYAQVIWLRSERRRIHAELTVAERQLRDEIRKYQASHG